VTLLEVPRDEATDRTDMVIAAISAGLILAFFLAYMVRERLRR
jgi:hypothetical protein